jgi:hypothetical protein
VDARQTALLKFRMFVMMDSVNIPIERRADAENDLFNYLFIQILTVIESFLVFIGFTVQGR